MNKTLAGMLAKSPFLKTGRQLWEANRDNYHFPMSKKDKLLAGVYLILQDYSEGKFPPIFEDRQMAYQAEMDYKTSFPGVAEADVTDALMRKPFWFSKQLKQYLNDFLDLIAAFERIGVRPPQKLLELGCGTGWMAEFLVLEQFPVVGTSIAPAEIQDAQIRAKSVAAKNLATPLEFRVSPMETVDQVVGDQVPFDVVFVFEALHHAYDWRQALGASYACLRPGGWLIIANEPNVIHTYVSYRVAKLTNTHEIGLSRGALVKRLKQTGFTRIVILKNRVSYFIKPHWIAAQK